MKAASVRPLVGKTIGIVGGGVGGLALAVGLQERIKKCASALGSSNQSGSESMMTKVFVYDGANPPSPPGTLLLGLNKGALSSLKQISEKVAKDVQDEGARIEGINLIDTQGVMLEQIGMNPSAATAEILAIPRDTIRSIFLRHIEDRSTIFYRDPIVAVKNVAEKVVNAEGTGTAMKNKICVELERSGAQPSKRHDLVVGCDGLNSVVRRHLFARLHDIGIDRQRYLKLFGIAGVAQVKGEDIPEELQNRVANVFSESEHVVLSFQSYKSLLYWHLAFHMQGQQEIGSPQSLRSNALSAIDGWYQPFRKIIENSSLDSITGMHLCDRDPLSIDDLGKKSLHRALVIGDALHPLCPFVGGFGENTNISLGEVSLLCNALEPFLMGQKEGSELDDELMGLQKNLAELGRPLLEDARTIALRVVGGNHAHHYISREMEDKMQEKKEGGDINK